MSKWTAPMLEFVSTLSRGARRQIENSSPVPLAQRTRPTSMFGYRPNDQMLTYLEVYANDPVVRPVVARLTQAVSETSWHHYTKSSTGEEQDRTEITSSALLDLLAKPNSFQGFDEIMARGQQHWELTGETNIILGFQKGFKYPIDMWVLRPDRITPVPDPYEFLVGWLYKAPGDGEDIPINVGELMRMVDPDPTDPYRGQGAVQAMLRDIDASRFTKEWQANFFLNSAQPGGLVEMPLRLGDDEWVEFQQRWAQAHQGVSKAHRVAMLEQGAKWVPNSFSLKDLQMAELDSLGRDKTLAAFGMPKSMIGVVEDVNRANAEAGEYVFARWMTRPRLVKWRAMLNRQLLPYFDPRGVTELDFADPVPDNSEANIAELNTKAGVLVELVAAGFDSAEVLEFIDWPELKYTKPAITHLPQPATEQGTTVPTEGDKLTRDPKTDMIRVKSILGEQGPPAGVQKMLRELSDWKKLDSAMRWVVRGHPDDNCCDPCKKNIGKLYRNRSTAYADYPPGKGYVECVGAQYGNHCRCHVAKRREDRG